MPMWRCYGCGREFEAEKPACADCELDPAASPRDAGYFARLETIHLDPPTKLVNRGKGYAACNPALKVGVADIRATGEPAVVNCKACRATDAWKAAAAERGLPAVPSELDVPVTIDPAAMKITATDDAKG